MCLNSAASRRGSRRRETGMVAIEEDQRGLVLRYSPEDQGSEWVGQALRESQKVRFERITQKHLRAETVGDSAQMFAQTASLLCRALTQYASFRTPQGLGLGPLLADSSWMTVEWTDTSLCRHHRHKQCSAWSTSGDVRHSGFGSPRINLAPAGRNLCKRLLSKPQFRALRMPV